MRDSELEQTESSETVSSAVAAVSVAAYFFELNMELIVLKTRYTPAQNQI